MLKTWPFNLFEHGYHADTSPVCVVVESVCVALHTFQCMNVLFCGGPERMVHIPEGTGHCDEGGGVYLLQLYI